MTWSTVRPNLSSGAGGGGGAISPYLTGGGSGAAAWAGGGGACVCCAFCGAFCCAASAAGCAAASAPASVTSSNALIASLTCFTFVMAKNPLINLNEIDATNGLWLGSTAAGSQVPQVCTVKMTASSLAARVRGAAAKGLLPSPPGINFDTVLWPPATTCPSSKVF